MPAAAFDLGVIIIIYFCDLMILRKLFFAFSYVSYPIYILFLAYFDDDVADDDDDDDAAVG